MLMVFAQLMEMIIRGPIGAHKVLWGLNKQHSLMDALHVYSSILHGLN